VPEAGLPKIHLLGDLVNRDDPPSIRCAEALKALLLELRSTSSLCTLRYYKVRLGGVEAKNFVL
jgi:hypothetical protein